MPKIDKNKKLNLPSKSKKMPKKTKNPVKVLAKPRTVHSKENTIAYYKCMIDKVANSPAKITQQARECKCTKKEVAQAQQEHKQQLVKQLAKNYLSFGESLGHYLHADIVGCAKELKK